LLKQLLNFDKNDYFLAELSIAKYFGYQYGVTQVNPSVAVHLLNSNKQHSDSGKIVHQQ